jgi:polyisoprenoid-binding protein YceI
MDILNKSLLKQIALLCILIGYTNTTAQGKFMTKSGAITFEASVPAFEEVKASNNKVTAIINTNTGEFAALALVKGFRFKISLMEEHFNENYAESDKYPKAKFTGKIIDYKNEKSNNTQKVVIKGALTFHGVTKELEIPAELVQDEESIQLSSSFDIKPSEFNIKIPSIVSKKIAETIAIKLNFNLLKK